MQCFTIWIAMQFVHACCLSLYLQLQSLGRRSHRGGSTNRTKGSTAMSPGWRQSKRVNSTWLGDLTHGVCTQKAAASKRLEVSAQDEHNSPSPPTLIPRDQFQIHELTGDICWDGALPSPVRDWSHPDDDSHAKEESFEQTPVSPTHKTMKVAKVGITL